MDWVSKVAESKRRAECSQRLSPTHSALAPEAPVSRQEQPWTYTCRKLADERMADLQILLSPTFIFQVLKDLFFRGGVFSERLFMRQHMRDAPNKATSPHSGS